MKKNLPENFPWKLKNGYSQYLKNGKSLQRSIRSAGTRGDQLQLNLKKGVKNVLQVLSFLFSFNLWFSLYIFLFFIKNQEEKEIQIMTL